MSDQAAAPGPVSAGAGALPGRPAPPDLADAAVSKPVLSGETVFVGRVWDVVAEEVDLGHSVVRREYTAHPGAVAVVAIDDTDRVLLLRQYRHPARRELWEPPAGLLDVAGESALETTVRELAEEADLVAGRWEHLVSFNSSPGGSSEEIAVYRAWDLAPVPEPERHERTEEEADLEPVWVPFADAVAAVLSGRLHSPTAVVGILAEHARRAAASGPGSASNPG